MHYLLIDENINKKQLAQIFQIKMIHLTLNNTYLL